MERAMLNKLAFVNSLAVLTAALYVLFALLALVAPRVFGANVALLFPKVQPSGGVSRDAGPHDWHVVGRGVRVGLAVQSVREAIVG
jgi:hypothetical protein